LVVLFPPDRRAAGLEAVADQLLVAGADLAVEVRADAAADLVALAGQAADGLGQLSGLRTVVLQLVLVPADPGEERDTMIVPIVMISVP
jgi:hypothetical protein